MFILSCGALSRPFSLVFVKTLPKEERPSRKRKKEEYNKKRREMSGEIVKGRSSIYRKILRYYSTVHLQFYPYYYTYPYTYPYAMGVVRSPLRLSFFFFYFLFFILILDLILKF
jgi:hypothetical protein